MSACGCGRSDCWRCLNARMGHMFVAPNMGTVQPRFNLRIEMVPQVFEIRRSHDWGWCVTLNWKGRRYQAKLNTFDQARDFVQWSRLLGMFIGREVGVPGGGRGFVLRDAS